MLKTPETKGKFFAVKFSTVIQGMRHVPAVCYPVPAELQSAVDEMAAKGLARVFSEKVRFVTGSPIR